MEKGALVNSVPFIIIIIITCAYLKGPQQMLSSRIYSIILLPIIILRSLIDSQLKHPWAMALIGLPLHT
ncbi:hypothetical protein CLU79DRAFT_746468 [Phycomyces nitens]|nr:hypothetical protein CLU79DRAFT_746468 [Phycomyces nitens]